MRRRKNLLRSPNAAYGNESGGSPLSSSEMGKARKLILNSSILYSVISGPVTSLAIVWLLFSIDFKRIRLAGPKMLGPSRWLRFQPWSGLSSR